MAQVWLLSLTSSVVAVSSEFTQPSVGPFSFRTDDKLEIVVSNAQPLVIELGKPSLFHVISAKQKPVQALFSVFSEETGEFDQQVSSKLSPL